MIEEKNNRIEGIIKKMRNKVIGKLKRHSNTSVSPHTICHRVDPYRAAVLRIMIIKTARSLDGKLLKFMMQDSLAGQDQISQPLTSLPARETVCSYHAPCSAAPARQHTASMQTVQYSFMAIRSSLVTPTRMTSVTH